MKTICILLLTETLSISIMNEAEAAIVSFAQSLSLATPSNDSNVDTILNYGVPKVLLTILSSDSAISSDCQSISENVAKSLFDIANLDQRISRQVAKDGGVEIMSRLISQCKHDQTVLYASKVITVLSLIEEDRRSTGRLVLVELMKSAGDELFSEDCISSILLALANIALQSDANKNIISSNVPQSLNKTRVPSLATATLICNASFRNTCAAYNFLQSGIVDELIERCIDIVIDETEDCLLLQRMMMMCANISNSQQNQCLLQSNANLILLITRILQIAEDASLLKAACKACASLCYDSTTARRSFGKDGAIALVDIILRMGLHDETNADKLESITTEAACKALSCLIIDDMIREQLTANLEDIQSLIQLFLQTESLDIVLPGGATVVSAMLPSEDEKAALVSEGRLSFIEKEKGALVLSRCLKSTYSNDDDLQPVWLKNAIKITRTTGVVVMPASGNEKEATESYAEADLSKYFPRDDLFESVVVDFTDNTCCLW